MDRLWQSIDPLAPEMEAVRTVNCGPEIEWYSVVTRAAFAKSFDFTHWTLRQETDTSMSFWVVATLRGIVEDIIVLSAIKSLSPHDRSQLLSAWMSADLIEGTKAQAAFFSTSDRFQAVIRPQPTADTDLSKLHSTMNDIWRSNNLRPGSNGKGNIRSLAVSAGLSDVYEYFYKLASRLVHFSPSILLRSGWGDMEGQTIQARFRPTNFDRYYTAVAKSYSALLLAEFIERFAFELSLSNRFSSAAQDIRDELKQTRLPELITYEEMNLRPPNVLSRAIEAMVRTGEIPL